MHQNKKSADERTVTRIKKTGVLWKIPQGHESPAAKKTRKTAKGSYSLHSDEIIQD